MADLKKGGDRIICGLFSSYSHRAKDMTNRKITQANFIGGWTGTLISSATQRLIIGCKAVNLHNRRERLLIHRRENTTVIPSAKPIRLIPHLARLGGPIIIFLLLSYGSSPTQQPKGNQALE